jgi:hypothetical protein
VSDLKNLKKIPVHQRRFVIFATKQKSDMLTSTIDWKKIGIPLIPLFGFIVIYKSETLNLIIFLVMKIKVFLLWIDT